MVAFMHKIFVLTMLTNSVFVVLFYKPPPPAAGNHTKRAFREGPVAPPPKKLTVENDQLVLHRNSTENGRLFRVRDGNNPFEGDFHVGIVERCTQYLGVVGW